MASKTKIDKVLRKVKKVKTSVEFIQSTNLTVLHEIVDLLQSNPAGDLVAEMAPIKACMGDPQVKHGPSPLTLTALLVGAVHSNLQWQLQPSLLAQHHRHRHSHPRL